MRRLRKKRISLAISIFESLRSKRRTLTAEWAEGDINDPNLVQQVTDIMANGGQMQIEYNGEWKIIEPYGWNSSKAGNVLLMCYKDTGEVRSYRLDRITNVQFDSDSFDSSQYGLGNDDEQESFNEFDVPELKDENYNDEQNQEETPFDEAIEVLEQVNDEFIVDDLRQQNQEDKFEPVKEDQYNPSDLEQFQSEDQSEDQIV